MHSERISLAVVLSVTMAMIVSTEALSVNFTMKESDSVGHKVGNITEQILDLVTVPAGQIPQYSFITEGIGSRFSLHNTSGGLYTQVMIDREDQQSGCKFRRVCTLNFTVGLLIGTEFWEILVSVHVLDVNDNNPEFPQPVKTLSIMEDVAVNTSFVLESAVDLDMGDGNGIQSYSMTTVSDTFGFKATRQDNGAFLLEIYLKKALDREITPSYQLHIVARDGGSPARTGTLTLNIEVQDKNDNAPKFSTDVYNVTVSEDELPGTVFLTLAAVDRDVGANAQVFYRIKQNQADYATISSYFSVDRSSGQVSISSVLQYREGLFYMFYVEALDQGEPQRDSQATVYVYVLDAGNNAPTITLSSFSPGNSGLIHIAENSPNNSFIAHLTVRDTDSGPSGHVSCVVSDTKFLITSTSQTGHIVSLVSSIDRETQDRYQLVVTCADNDPVPLSASVTLTISVTDLNDNAPVFEVTERQVSVFENTETEVTIAQVSASDRDAGNNAALTYHIVGQDKIVVDPTNGIVKVVSAFDREVTPVVVFEVLAMDQGSSPLTGTSTITLLIRDLNDNAPQFNTPIYIFQVQENLPSSTVVGQLSGTDIDDGDNAKVSFSMAPSSSATNVPFIVFSSGQIRTNQELDRERQNRYDFTVLVKDQGVLSLSSTAQVTINVGDQNDNSPIFRFPTDGNHSVSILYPNQSVSYVTRVSAYDIDSGENRTLQYSIKDGNKFKMFKIDEVTGVVSFARQDAPIERDESVSLLVEARDRGQPSLSSTTVLLVQLVYSNATMSPLDGGDNKYIVISVVVVVITVLISAAIIAIIFLIRFLDGRKQEAPRNVIVSESGFESMPSKLLEPTPSPESSNLGKKKKEVSFSLEENDSVTGYLSSQLLRVSNIPNTEKQLPPDQVSTVSEYTKKATLLQSLRLNQLLLENKDRQKQAPVARHEDSHSDSSAETAQSDSGRGGSEEDMPSNSLSADDPHTFDLPRASMKNNEVQNQFISHNLSFNTSRADNSSPVPPPIPSRTYKTYSSFSDNRRNYQECSPPQCYSPRGSNEVPLVDVASLSWEHHYPTHQSAVDYSNFQSYPVPYTGVSKCKDDDDCSTTTSGSYTIYSEDML